MGTLLELGTSPGGKDLLGNLSFLAKFVHKTHGIMRRIGRDAEGYDKLAREFTENLEKATGLVTMLLRDAPDDVRDRFGSVYLVMAPAGLDNLLALFHDLSWYKNWLIDSGAERGSRA